MRHQFHEESGDVPLARTEAAEELAALIQMTRFMADLIPRLVDDPQQLKAQLDRLEAELGRELSLAQLHSNSAAN
jgi:hypothetical protein